MIISHKQKEDLIRKLLNEKHTYRDIAAITHSSPNEIARIRRKITGENTEANEEIDSKSICSRAFDLFQKGVSLPQAVIDLDIEPEQVKKFHESYLNLANRQNIVSLLKDEKDVQLKIDILDFLQTNPHHLKKIKETIDIQNVIWEVTAEIEELKDERNDAKNINKYYDSKLEEKRKKILKSQEQ